MDANYKKINEATKMIGENSRQSDGTSQAAEAGLCCH